MVGLYFAAAWCPMSTPITSLLIDLFGSLLGDPNNTRFTIVYVSSDKSIEAYQAYLQPGWKAVPFESAEERAAMKKHFRICAKKEMQELGLTSREDEIPHLKVLSGNEGKIVTSTGVADLKELRTGALDHWESFRVGEKYEAISQS